MSARAMDAAGVGGGKAEGVALADGAGAGVGDFGAALPDAPQASQQITRAVRHERER